MRGDKSAAPEWRNVFFPEMLNPYNSVYINKMHKMQFYVYQPIKTPKESNAAHLTFA